LSPFYFGLSSRRDRQHPLVEIKANNLTLSPDAPNGLAYEHACPAANVENSVPRSDSSGISDPTGPSAEDRRYEAGLVYLGSIR